MSARDATADDKLIGRHITIAMRDRGTNRAKLAKKLDINRFQLQKYETAENRIPASRLFELAKYLGINDLRYFLKWLPPIPHRDL